MFLFGDRPGLRGLDPEEVYYWWRASRTIVGGVSGSQNTTRQTRDRGYTGTPTAITAALFARSPGTFGSTTDVMSQFDASTGGTWRILMNSDGTLNVRIYNGLTLLKDYDDNGTWDDDVEHHLLFTFQSGVSGTHDGSNNASTLSDTGNFAAYGTNGLAGGTVYNTTDGSSGTITANDDDTVTATLSGGTDADWDTGDAYTIDALRLWVDGSRRTTITKNADTAVSSLASNTAPIVAGGNRGGATLWDGPVRAPAFFERILSSTEIGNLGDNAEALRYFAPTRRMRVQG